MKTDFSCTALSQTKLSTLQTSRLVFNELFFAAGDKNKSGGEATKWEEITLGKII